MGIAKFILFLLLVLNTITTAQWAGSYVGYLGSGIDIKYLSASTIIASQRETFFFNPENAELRLRVIKSYNGGTSWSIKHYYSIIGQPFDVTTLSFFDQVNGIFVLKPNSASISQLYKSSNGGETFNNTNISFTQGFTPLSVSYVNQSIILAIFRYGTGYNNHYIFRSSNSGTNWAFEQTINPKRPNKIYSYNPGNTFIVADSGVILKSTNAGLNWAEVNTGYPFTIYDIAFLDSLRGLAVGGPSNQSYIFKTTNGGINWSLNYTSNIALTLRSVSIADSNFVYVSSDKILGTSNGGASWIQQANLPANVSYISAWNRDTAICYSRDHVFRTFIGVITGSQQNQNQLPEKFVLHNCFPNPFNPTTNIKFDIKEKTTALLEIYNVTGQKIETLINESLDAGSYNVEWNANDYSSGIYFYRFTTEKFTQTQKAVLIK